MERKDVVDEISISIHFVPFRKIKDVPKQIKRSNILLYFERSEIIQNWNLGYFDLINDIPKLFKRIRDLCVFYTLILIPGYFYSRYSYSRSMAYTTNRFLIYTIRSSVFEFFQVVWISKRFIWWFFIWDMAAEVGFGKKEIKIDSKKSLSRIEKADNKIQYGVFIF